MKAFTPSIKMINDLAKPLPTSSVSYQRKGPSFEGSAFLRMSSPHTDPTGKKNGKCGRRKDKATALEQIYPKD